MNICYLLEIGQWHRAHPGKGLLRPSAPVSWADPVYIAHRTLWPHGVSGLSVECDTAESLFTVGGHRSLGALSPHHFFCNLLFKVGPLPLCEMPVDSYGLHISFIFTYGFSVSVHQHFFRNLSL